MRVKKWEDVRAFIDRSGHSARIIEAEVLNKNHNALIIFGGAHFYRSSNVTPRPGRLREILEKRMKGGKIFVILPLSSNDRFSKDFLEYSETNTFPSFVNLIESDFPEIEGDNFFSEADGKLRNFTDGVLFFGVKSDSISANDLSTINDSIYQKELKRRRDLILQFYINKSR